jgi:hypothetical protein
MVRCVFFCLLGAAAFNTPLQASDKEDSHKIPDAARAILEKAEAFELLSLDPVEPKEKVKDDFHGWKVLGKTTVKEAASRKQVVESFEKGVSEYKEGPAKCFNPRHGIRVTHEGKTADFVICFECAQTHVSVKGEKVETFLVSQSPADVFNEVLKKAGVPLAKPAREK